MRVSRSRAATSGFAENDLLARNRAFYDSLWSGARLVRPERFNSWPLIHGLLSGATDRLEIAPGLRPRLPVSGTLFVDISGPALTLLRANGGMAILADAAAVPLPGASFDLLCAFDIIEHLEDDEAGFVELARLARPDGILLLSVPLHSASWTGFDDLVGHRRRYEPEQLVDQLSRHGFAVERSAAFGMRPKSSRLAEFGLALMAKYPRRAFWCYNNLMMPLAVLLQQPLQLRDGLGDVDGFAEVLLVCRKTSEVSTVASPDDGTA